MARRFFYFFRYTKRKTFLRQSCDSDFQMITETAKKSKWDHRDSVYFFHLFYQITLFFQFLNKFLYILLGIFNRNFLHKALVTGGNFHYRLF